MSEGTSKKIAELTGLRAVAVSMVIAGHIRGTLGPDSPIWLSQVSAFLSGSRGVLIFFVLSGFLITRLLRDEFVRAGSIDYWAFYKRRALRIWPASYAYIFCMALLTVFGVMDIAKWELIAALGHYWNYCELMGASAWRASRDGTWYLGHFWSLALEEQFYWIWPPIFLFAIRRRQNSLILILITLMPVFRVVSYYLFPGLRGQLSMMLHTGLDPILVGCYLALNEARITCWLRESPVARYVSGVAVLQLFILSPLVDSLLARGWHQTGGKLLDAVACAIVIGTISCVPAFWLSRLLRMRPLVFLGAISFSAYLWQQVFTGKAMLAVIPAWLAPLLILAAAAASYFLIELPAQRRITR